MSFFKCEAIQPVEVYKWLDWAAQKNPDVLLALPMIQRGSVWKPAQIIDLWDSLLQGMPIGSMLASEPDKGTPVCQWDSKKCENLGSERGLVIVDGHQRTLAMLAGWPRQENVVKDSCLWIDFADEPAPGQLLRLRLTTKNHPFGFRRDKPSSKLSLDKRRKAHDDFYVFHDENTSPGLDNAIPFSSGLSLPIRMSWLIKCWNKNNRDFAIWGKEIEAELRKFRIPKKTKDEDDKQMWESLNEKTRDSVRDRIHELHEALWRLFKMQIPIIRLDNRFLKPGKGTNNNPPLEVIFKRIGTNGTPLSPRDYAYSIIKNRRPDTYTMVEKLHSCGNVASLLTPTDLVMSAVRLAAVKLPESGDPEDPSIRELSRLLGDDSFIKDEFLPLIKDKEKPNIASYFEKISAVLLFRDGKDIGLPKQVFPLLDRPLVQILLRLVQNGYLSNNNKSESRHEVLRLVMFWLIAVTNKHKASRIAYKIIKDVKDDEKDHMISAIYEKTISERTALRLPSPDTIKEVLGLACSSNTDKVSGESRFQDSQNNKSEAEIRNFYRNYWWQPWTHQHPILLWFQRGMIQREFSNDDPMAGKDEDTPYDYDHILPKILYDGRKSKSAKDYEGFNVIGNSIGNIRVITHKTLICATTSR